MKALKFNEMVFNQANDKTIIDCKLLGVSGVAAVPAFMLMNCIDGVHYSCNLLASRVVSRVVVPIANKLNGKRYNGKALPKDLNFFLFETSDIMQLMIDIKKTVGFGAMVDDAKILE